VKGVHVHTQTHQNRFGSSVCASAGTASMKTLIIPASAVVPTCDRAPVLKRTLASLAEQSVLPTELIVIDGSSTGASREVVEEFERLLSHPIEVCWRQAEKLGAAIQRNQGVTAASQPFILFFDDDVLFEEHCLARLWSAIDADPRLGGVNAMITNQKYHQPGPASRTVFTILHGRNELTFAGRVIGPAVNLAPEDRDDLPEVVPIDWLNLACALYRREAIPNPPFDSIFTGYSIAEDVALSVRVGKNWRLANARTAKIFHDSQPGAHKTDVSSLAEMELVNRHYIMSKLLGRNQWSDYVRLFAWEAFSLLATLAARDRRRFFLPQLRGMTRGLRRCVKRSSTEY
jgi:glycosyltransferase involved in cell wall biosynthesis